MQIKGDRIVCNIFHHVACFGCGKGIATTYADAREARAMARAAGAKKLTVAGGSKQWHCKSCAVEQKRALDECKSCGRILSPSKDFCYACGTRQ